MTNTTWHGNGRASGPGAKELRLTRQFLFLSVIFTASFSLLCYMWQLRTAFYLEVALTFVFMLLYLAARAGYMQAAQYIFIVVINVQMFCLCLCFGRRSQMHLIFVPVAAVPFVLFGIRNLWRLLLFSLLTIGFFTGLFIIGFDSPLDDAIAPHTMPYVELACVVLSIICELIVIYSFISTSDKTEQKLDESNAFLQLQLAAIFDNSQDALFLVDGSTRKITKVNRRAVEMFEMSAEEDFYSLGGLELHRYPVTELEMQRFRSELLTHGVYETEILYRAKTGREFWGALAIRLITIQGRDYQAVRVKDIHQQKMAQESTRASLQEKEVLLAEIHHRVKNNMAIISGLLGLQAGYVEDAEAKKLFEESRNRIHSMALIHEMLYKHETLSQIEFGTYIHDLISHLERSFSFSPVSIGFSVSCSDIFMDIKSAVPCGLILNELITNSFKHAFKGRPKGHITVRCEKNDGFLVLQVADDGFGFDAPTLMQQPKTLGLTLINGLVDQLGGQLSISNQGGTAYTIAFKA